MRAAPASVGLAGRPLWVAFLLLTLLAAFARPAHAEADAGAIQASLTCDHVDGPGRVRCEAEARAPAGQSIKWGDVVLLDAPPFTLILRGRIGPREATLQQPDVWRWAFAIAARQKGTGDLGARIRMVVCQGKTCGPVEVSVSGKVVVGP